MTLKRHCIPFQNKLYWSCERKEDDRMSYGYGYGGYNPLQSRMDSLMQQRQMIDQQLQSLQQMGNVPPVTINNNMTPQQQGVNGMNFDFNGKWVDNEEQAKRIMTTNLPLIAFDNNNPIFYMKGSDGNFRKYRFEEIIDATPTSDPQIEQRMSNLENKLDTLINALSQPVSKPADTNTSSSEKPAQTQNKQQTRGGSK